MIHFSVPSVYAGVYGMHIILDIAQRYYPELRRWSLVEEDLQGTRILLDKQTKETVEIPQYNFALFPGGTPVVVPFELMSVIAPPNPRVIVPSIDTIQKVSDFSTKTNSLLADNIGAKLVVDGPKKDTLYLDHPVDYVYLPRWYPARERDRVDSDRARIKLVEGDTLFSYLYPRELRGKGNHTSGEVDYMPTSVVKNLTEVPAVDSFDLSTPVHMRDWSQIWPRKK